MGPRAFGKAAIRIHSSFGNNGLSAAVGMIFEDSVALKVGNADKVTIRVLLIVLPAT